jgi:hypothetical protein
MPGSRTTATVTASTADRAQLLVVAALALAGLIITLALVLNAGAYTRATTGPEFRDEPGEAREFRAETAAGVGGLVGYVNNNSSFASYEELNDTLAPAVADWSANVSHHEAIEGRGVRVRLNGTVNGTRIAQNRTRHFLSPTTRVNWTVGENVNRTRQFRMNVTNDTLVDFDPTINTPNEFNGSDYFRVNLTPSGGQSRQIFIYNGTESRVFLRVQRPDESGGQKMSPRCSAPTNTKGQSTLYLTAEQVEHQDCDPLRVFDRISNYSIDYQNGDAINGSYELYVDRNRSDVLTAQPTYGTDAGTQPFVENATYAAVTAIDYKSTAVRYDVKIDATPADLTVEKPRPLGALPALVEPPSVAFVLAGSNEIQTVNNTGIIVSYGNLPNTAGIGSPTNFSDGTNIIKVPLATRTGGGGPGGQRRIRVSEPGGGGTSILSDDGPQATPTTLAVGTWQGSITSIFFPSPTSGDDEIRRTNPNPPNDDTRVQLGNGNGVRSVAGIADVDADGADEIVYTGGSQQVHYLDDDNTTIFELGDVQTGDPPGIGTPADFDDDGRAGIPYVDDSGEIRVAEIISGQTTTNGPSGEGLVLEESGAPIAASKTAMATVDWDSDRRQEIVYVNTTGTLRYVDDVLGTNRTITITDSGGSPISVDQDIGVR